MAQFIKKSDGKVVQMHLPEAPERRGMMAGYLQEVTVDHDHLRHSSRVMLRIEMDETTVRENGGFGWLQPGKPVWISQ